MTLAEFLLARIAEDEAVAQAASHGGWIGPESMGAFEGGDTVYIDPARVLAECEAKRRIVELHAPVIPVSPFSKCGHPGCDQSHSEKRLPPACPTCPTSDVDGACETLYTLAIPYVDHPDYRDEWRP